MNKKLLIGLCMVLILMGTMATAQADELFSDDEKEREEQYLEALGLLADIYRERDGEDSSDYKDIIEQINLVDEGLADLLEQEKDIRIAFADDFEGVLHNGEWLEISIENIPGEFVNVKWVSTSDATSFIRDNGPNAIINGVGSKSATVTLKALVSYKVLDTDTTPREVEVTRSLRYSHLAEGIYPESAFKILYEGKDVTGTTLTLQEGDSVKLETVPQSISASWEAEDNNYILDVIDINPLGEITAKSTGTAYITATFPNAPVADDPGDLSKKFTIIVEEAPDGFLWGTTKFLGKWGIILVVLFFALTKGIPKALKGGKDVLIQGTSMMWYIDLLQGRTGFVNKWHKLFGKGKKYDKMSLEVLLKRLRESQPNSPSSLISAIKKKYEAMSIGELQNQLYYINRSSSQYPIIAEVLKEKYQKMSIEELQTLVDTSRLPNPVLIETLEELYGDMSAEELSSLYAVATNHNKSYLETALKTHYQKMTLQELFDLYSEDPTDLLDTAIKEKYQSMNEEDYKALSLKDLFAKYNELPDAYFPTVALKKKYGSMDEEDYRGTPLKDLFDQYNEVPTTHNLAEMLEKKYQSMDEEDYQNVTIQDLLDQFHKNPGIPHLGDFFKGKYAAMDNNTLLKQLVEERDNSTPHLLNTVNSRFTSANPLITSTNFAALKAISTVNVVTLHDNTAAINTYYPLSKPNEKKLLKKSRPISPTLPQNSKFIRLSKQQDSPIYRALTYKVNAGTHTFILLNLEEEESSKLSGKTYKEILEEPTA